MAGGRSKGASGGSKQPTNADLIRQSKQYQMVGSDDEDYAKAMGVTSKKVRAQLIVCIVMTRSDVEVGPARGV
jgi:hypothetical protein